jgi:hypothetical protein
MHKATGELYALKCISLYVKQMRDQLMTELRMLFKSDCEGLIDFYGAVYREVRVRPFPCKNFLVSPLNGSPAAQRAAETAPGGGGGGWQISRARG